MIAGVVVIWTLSNAGRVVEVGRIAGGAVGGTTKTGFAVGVAGLAVYVGVVKVRSVRAVAVASRDELVLVTAVAERVALLSDCGKGSSGDAGLADGVSSATSTSQRTVCAHSGSCVRILFGGTSSHARF